MVSHEELGSRGGTDTGGGVESTAGADKDEDKDTDGSATSSLFPRSSPPMVTLAAGAYRVYESQGVVRVTIERSSSEGTVSIGYVTLRVSGTVRYDGLNGWIASRK